MIECNTFLKLFGFLLSIFHIATSLLGLTVTMIRKFRLSMNSLPGGCVVLLVACHGDTHFCVRELIFPRRFEDEKHLCLLVHIAYESWKEIKFHYNMGLYYNICDGVGQLYIWDTLS